MQGGRDEGALQRSLEMFMRLLCVHLGLEVVFPCFGFKQTRKNATW